MSLVTLPAEFRPRSCQLTLTTVQRVSADNFGGSEQAVDLLGDRWVMACELPESKHANAAWREAFIGAMRGQVNTVNLWHFTRPQPRGTVRGTLTLNAAVAQGAASIVVTGCSPANGTFLAGDMVGVGGLLLMSASDCIAVAGVMTIPVTNRIRKALTIGASVTWDKPSAPFRILSTSGVGYQPGRASATSFDFGEAIS